MLYELIFRMAALFGERHYVEHALKVLGYARAIAGAENLSDEDLHILEAAAAIHDIGIPEALRLHGSGAGPYQEAEGARIAPDMLRSCGYDESVCGRVSWLIAHHHSPAFAKDDPVLQILLEADDLTNLSEGKASSEKIAKSRAELFKTRRGLALLEALFPPET